MASPLLRRTHTMCSKRFERMRQVGQDEIQALQTRMQEVSDMAKKAGGMPMQETLASHANNSFPAGFVFCLCKVIIKA